MTIHSNAAAVVVAMTALGGLVGCADEDVDNPGEPTPPAPITTQFELKTGMRELWTDHVTWTRVFLMDAIADLPDTPFSTERLLQNQDDLGAAIKPFYGDSAGDDLAALLRVHITGAADVVAAAKAGDEAGLEAANTAWYENAEEISKFLSDANPNLPPETIEGMMEMHLDQTLDEATARLTGDWTADVAIYDEIVVHILGMSDGLSQAVSLQFPDKVAVDTTMTADNQELHLAMRKLWEDHVTWTRVFLISAIAGLPDTDAATDRLLQNQLDIGNAIKPFYGDEAGDQLATLLYDHITLAYSVVVAAQGQPTQLNGALAQWYANADQIAEFLAAANPNWNVDDLKSMMKTHLDQTLAEATARLESDWETDVRTYDEIVDHILHMADVLSDGIALQFPDKLGEVADGEGPGTY